jgi:hypothetical protein
MPGYIEVFSHQVQPWKGFGVLARGFNPGNWSGTTYSHSAVPVQVSI